MSSENIPNPLFPVQKFVLNWDDGITFNTNNGAAVDSLVGVLNLQSVVTNSNRTDQNLQFFALMNMYQEFRWVMQEFDYEPTFTGTDQAAWVNALIKVANNQYDPEDAHAYALAVANMNSSTIVYVPDTDDRLTRSTLNEYFMVRAHPNAVSFRVNQRFNWSYSPSTLKMVMSPDASAGSGSNNAHAQVIVNPGNNTGMHGINTTTPMQVPFMSTKVIYRPSPGTNTLQFNIADNWFGYKRYMYTPDNTYVLPNGDVTVRVGIRHMRTHLEFRNPDFRAWLSTPSFSLGDGDNTALKIAGPSQKTNFIDHIQDEFELVRSATFKTDVDEQNAKLQALPVKKRKIDEVTPLVEEEKEHL